MSVVSFIHVVFVEVKPQIYSGFFFVAKIRNYIKPYQILDGQVPYKMFPGDLGI